MPGLFHAAGLVRRVARSGTFVLTGLLALAACDSQVPPRTNPFDPDFDGPRTATAPTDLALVSATPTTVTLSWTDRSSFETGVRVERRPSGAFFFTAVATLPPDATTYTDTGLTGSEPLDYRVVALVAGGTESAPSGPQRIRFPADTLRLSVPDLAQAQISPDGERLYTRDAGGTRITNLRTGASVGTIPRASAIIGFLADGRVAFRENTPQPSTLGVRFFDGPVQQTLATLRFPSPPYPLTQGGCTGIGGSTTVSADGRRVADVCGDGVLVWTLPSDVPALYPLPRLTRRFTLSPDGSRLFAERLGNDAPTLAVLDAGTGALVWEAQNVREAPSATLFGLSADGTVMAYAAGGRLRVVDPASGAVRIEAPAGAFESVLAVSDAAVLTSRVDPDRGTQTVRFLRADDLSLVRTLSPDVQTLVRLVPEGLVRLRVVEGRPVAIRLNVGASWEAAR